MAGWCPNGSWSGGICKPANNNRSNWMERYSGARVLPIGECVLLGTHNSGYDKQGPHSPSSQTCQDVPIYDQLKWGIRVLDLRVQFFQKRQGEGRFGIFHDTDNGRYIERDVLQPLLRFRRDYNAQREIVILNFHRFKNFTAEAHKELAGVLKQVLGKTVVPPACKALAVAQLWELGTNTVVSYNHGSRDASFWPGVNQRWIGHNQPRLAVLKAFVEKVGTEPKAFGDLRSVQAARYREPFFVPHDLSGEVMGWFAYKPQGGPINKHYIINTDWSLRCRMVDNVIAANGLRARQRGAHVIRSSPDTDRSASRLQTQSYGIFNMGNGYWSPSLDFAANTSGYTSIQVITSDADYASEIRYGASSQPIKRGDRLVFRVEPGKTPVLLARFNNA
ncbi:hypothetical protein [Pseudomonas sp. NPDC089401]|uniref:hypothetical protein n=1 Tax=Pseudomonas sp. NPDC089401 TaxID=3364462 RepID=UPI00382F1991